MTATLKDAYKLLHDGTLALANVEHNGMRIDTKKLDKTIDNVNKEIEKRETKLKDTKVWKKWKDRYKDKANIDSRFQLGIVFFQDMGFETDARTETGRPKTDEETLSKVNHPFAKTYLGLQKLKKLASTYLKGIRKEVCNGFLHPAFNLNLVKTFRGSSSGPNFQNIPIRDKSIGRLIRSCFIPREDHILVELDYGQLEVRIAACYNKDPVLIEYINDPTKDMHRDMAAECYMLTQEQVSKTARFCAKNQFVFPQFYGSYYIDCSRNLWNAIDTDNLETADGVSLKEHLRSKGIKKLGNCNPSISPADGTFERHIMEVEQDFWGLRFQVYDEWKKEWWAKYQETGTFKMLTGFEVKGVYRRNEVINSPVQGTAFHILLWSLIQLNNWLVNHNKKTKLIGQIHDSILADVHKSELKGFLKLAKRIMTVEVRKHWDWIIVPLEVEAEASNVNWFEKQEIEI